MASPSSTRSRVRPRLKKAGEDDRFRQASSRYQFSNRVKRVRVLRLLVVTPTCHAGKAHGDSRLVTLGELNAIEREFKDELGLHGMNRTEALKSVPSDEAVDLVNLFVGETGVRL